MRENPENDEAIRQNLAEGFISANPHTGEIWSHRVAGTWRKQPKLLSTKPTSNGYLRTTVTVEGREYTVFHHRIIWIAVHGSIPEAMCIDHKNGTKTDNRISNMHLLTKGDNVKVAFSQGLRSGKVLSDEERKQIKRLCKRSRMSQVEIAARFGCSQSMVSLLKREG